jgi:hypothetical protein
MQLTVISTTLSNKSIKKYRYCKIRSWINTHYGSSAKKKVTLDHSVDFGEMESKV